jgi:hypothetical protein
VQQRPGAFAVAVSQVEDEMLHVQKRAFRSRSMIRDAFRPPIAATLRSTGVFSMEPHVASPPRPSPMRSRRR